MYPDEKGKKHFQRRMLSDLEVIKFFSCSTQLSRKFSLLLTEKITSSAMLSKNEFAIVSNLRFISRTNYMLS